MLIDTHAHLNFKDFSENKDEIILESLALGMKLILVGSNKKTSKEAVSLAEKNKTGVFAAVGLHPAHLQKFSSSDEKYKTIVENYIENDYLELAKSKKVVAIGEIGIDYYYLKNNSNKNELKKKHQEVFLKQLKMARKVDKPVIIHCRDAHSDLLNILMKNKKYFPDKERWGVIHCFSGDISLAKKYFNLGLMISVNGLITFNNFFDQLIQEVNLKNVMLETDCPYLTPKPHRGKINKPSYLSYIAEYIANLKGIDFEEVSKITSENAVNFFKI